MKAVSSSVLMALGLFSTAAVAQSDLTIYGRLDGGFQYSKSSAIDGVEMSAKTALVSGHTNGSRWGIKGSEKLGGGLRAIYVLEAGISLDTGESGQSGRLFGREALVGLAGGAGTVAVGRFGGLSSGTGSFNMMSFDPFGTSFGNAAMKTSFVSKRFDNAVAYESAAIGGVRLAAMHSLAASGQEEPVADMNERYTGLGVGYRIGKLRLASTYEVIDLKNASKSADSLPDARSFQFGGYYDLPALRAYFNYERASDAPVRGVTKSAADADFYLVGLKASLPGGVGDLLASYQRRDGKAFRVAGSAETFEADLQVFALGYLYPLSKRTQLYASYVVTVGDKSWDKDGRGNGYGAARDSDRANYNSQTATVGLRTRF